MGGGLAPRDGFGTAVDLDGEVAAEGKGAPEPDGRLAGEFKVAVERFERVVERKRETTRRGRGFVVHYIHHARPCFLRVRKKCVYVGSWEG